MNAVKQQAQEWLRWVNKSLSRKSIRAIFERRHSRCPTLYGKQKTDPAARFKPHTRLAGRLPVGSRSETVTVISAAFVEKGKLRRSGRVSA